MILTFSESQIRNFVLTWAAGTLYMCLFALFVGMTRQYILRPGTLFFIRSPDDPNTRLIHDALMKPLRVQLRRITESALVYTVFILVGIGSVTHGLKSVDSPLLPLRVSFAVDMPSAALLWVLTRNMSLVRKYVRQYWTRAFKACARQMRLSSFMLGKHDPKERGHVEYRDWWCWIQGAQPDYTQPKSTVEAQELFSQGVKAVFVPDGYFVRAPKSDIASRSFIRKLFVPVTKDDIPLQIQQDGNTRLQATYLGDSEDEVSTYNQYELVYRPPHFGKRVILFLSMLWMFAVILISGVAVVANALGRPFAYCIAEPTTRRVMPKFLPGFEIDYLEFWSVQLDAGSILAGLCLMYYLLRQYDDHLIRAHVEGEWPHFTVREAWTGLVRNLEELNSVFRVCGLFLAMLLDFMWCQYIHYCGITEPVVKFWGQEASESPWSWGVHIAVSAVYTFLPLEKQLHKEMTSMVDLGINIATEGVMERVVYPVLKKLVWPMWVDLVLKCNILVCAQVVDKDYVNLPSAVIVAIDGEHTYQKWLTLTSPVIIGSCLAWRAGVWLRGYLSLMNAQVKEQYYAKGKTLENIALEAELEE